MRSIFRSALIALPLLVGCGAPEQVTPEPDVLGEEMPELTAAELRGLQLFTSAKFGGNGRTCLTCHSATTGTLSPKDAQTRYTINRSDPLFRSIDADNGSGSSYTRLLNDATILAGINLPPNVRLAGSSARSVLLPRGIPTTLNTPALDPVLMADGRQPSLTSQASSAIHGHYQSTVEPTSSQLSDIAAFEKTLFSSSALYKYAKYGTAPTLPAGTTASEQRGRRWFLADGFCGACHGGPMLNTTTEFTPFPNSRFGNIGVSEFNFANKPVRDYIFRNPDGSETTVSSTDPGLALITGDPALAGFFKIPTLWGVKKTAPYFHDNSAKSLEDVMNLYETFFLVVGPPFPVLTAQDKADIIAYMKLLN